MKITFNVSNKCSLVFDERDIMNKTAEHVIRYIRAYDCDCITAVKVARIVDQLSLHLKSKDWKALRDAVNKALSLEVEVSLCQ